MRIRPRWNALLSIVGMAGCVWFGMLLGNGDSYGQLRSPIKVQRQQTSTATGVTFTAGNTQADVTLQRIVHILERIDQRLERMERKLSTNASRVQTQSSASPSPPSLPPRSVQR